MSAEKEVWPDYLMIRDTGLHDDMGGLGQRIHTTAGAGYKKVKYVRADIAERDAAEIGRLRGEVESLGMQLSDEVLIAKMSAPAMPNGVEGLPAKWRRESERLRFSESARELNWYADELEAALRAAYNRDAAGVDAPADDQALYDGLNYACDIHPPSPDYTPAAVPAGEAVDEREARCIDANDGHSDSCACMHPGDRECTCHKAYGFATAEAMDAADCKHDYRETADDRLPSSWIDVCAKCGHERGTIYTTPPAPVQAAPQEGEAPHGRIRWLDDDYEIDWLRDWTGGDCDLYLAAHPSACELVVDDAMVERVCRNHFPDWDMYGPAGKMVRSADIRRLLTAALQHRGDSQEVGRG